ncbi:PrsW family glutamic-type intramembrane protease [Phytomonospora endophytica]|uniref:RsiW-degrading membrane proteinase PrsW (M82 family) n=1 Tax=Phytomonospora endophytica TaxID=714109 RepID=A0A841FKW3_9ACTN|nr:PrsW family glutamic-type intramembrane protease [Phytomonospora endophytica]MBB6036494.1 RsiW-degrading membrane proteinase PrsW (M82 family) [Phytomonospora endophytica]GIG65816.1 hypothetical protein Pen01_21110 [Phytomonospora endophytica]
MLSLNIFAAVLLVAGFAAAYVLYRPRAGVPAAGRYPDPVARSAARERMWDSRAWTAEVGPGDTAARVGPRFRGWFRGGWVLYLLGALLVLIAGGALYRSNDDVHVMAVTSFLAMSGVAWAFYRFTAARLALDDVISPVQVIAIGTATAGAVLLIAANLNSWLIDLGGTRLAAGTVGLVEEGTKLLVPLVLFALARYRDPRAGIGAGLAAGFGFAVAETTQYAYATASASGPDFCGGETADPTAAGVVSAQVTRVFTVSPLHWLWTGIAVAIAWRLWHLFGRRGTLGAVTAIVAVMAVHSFNDSSVTWGCGSPGLTFLFQVLRWAILVASYLVFKAAARRSTPPQLIGTVSPGWTPRRL